MSSPLDSPSLSDLGARIAAFEPFSGFAPAVIADIAPHLALVCLGPGQVLFHQGNPADALYLLTLGRLALHRRDEQTGDERLIEELNPGALVGELALLTGQPRAATVRAVGYSELVVFARHAFESVVAAHPDAQRLLAQHSLPRLRHLQLADVLQRLLGALDPPTLQHLYNDLEWRHLPGGQVLFRQGDPGDFMVIVINGRLRIVAQTSEGGERLIGEVTRGEPVGEFALLTGEPRTATVYAVRDSDVVTLSQPVFERLAMQYPRILMQVTRTIIGRQRPASRRVAARQAGLSLAVLPLTPDVPMETVTRHLYDGLMALGSTRLLSAASFDRDYGKPGAAQTREDEPANVSVVGWLSEQDRHHHYLLYQADADDSAWTRRCLRQADRILLVGHGDGDPRPGPLEQTLPQRAGKARLELLLLWPPTTVQPHGTAAWLAPRQLAAHHHARLDRPADFQRVARRLAGRAIGLALSGGGARGWAHAGAYRALAEAGIRADVVCGTSMGSLVAGGLACGLDYEQIMALADRFSSRQLIDYTFPIASLAASRNVTVMLYHVYGDRHIEDLWLPYFCVAANLTQAEPLILRQGPLWQAVRASIAIPGLFAPIGHNGDLLVDGGIMNNLPADVLRGDIEQGLLIAVNASPRQEPPYTANFGPSVSGWRVLLSRLLPLRQPIPAPSILSTLMRSLEVNSTYHLRRTRDVADIFIDLPTSAFKILDLGHYQQIVAVGYEAASQQLAAVTPELLDQARRGGT